MNVKKVLIHVMVMQFVPTLWDLSVALAILDTQAMVEHAQVCSLKYENSQFLYLR